MTATLEAGVALDRRAMPGMVNPFSTPQVDASNDTVISEALIKTTFMDSPGWKSVTLHTLSEVEDFLDSLEASGIANREVRTISNSTFSVRWK